MRVHQQNHWQNQLIFKRKQQQNLSVKTCCNFLLQKNKSQLSESMQTNQLIPVLKYFIQLCLIMTESMQQRFPVLLPSTFKLTIPKVSKRYGNSKQKLKCNRSFPFTLSCPLFEKMVCGLSLKFGQGLRISRSVTKFPNLPSPGNK